MSRNGVLQGQCQAKFSPDVYGNSAVLVFPEFNRSILGYDAAEACSALIKQGVTAVPTVS